MALEVREVQEGLEDPEVQEVREGLVVRPQKGRDHQEVPAAQEDLLQIHPLENRVVQEDLGDQEVLEDQEDPADLEDLEVRLQIDQNQDKLHPRRGLRKNLDGQEVRGDLEAQGDPEVPEVQVGQEDQVDREDQVGPKQQNDLQGNQPSPPRLQDPREGQEVPEGPEDLVGQEDPVALGDLVDQRQNPPVLLQNRPSMHQEIPAGLEVRADREGQAGLEVRVDREDQLRLLLRHPRHQNQVRKSNKAT